MSEHGDSDMDATEEINVDDSDSRSCSPRNYASHDGRHVSQDECSSSPPPSQTGARTLSNDSPRSHPFSISRLLGESGVQNPKSPSSEEPDSDKERKWSWEEGNNNNNNNNNNNDNTSNNNNNNNNNNNSQATPAGLLDQDPGRRSWGHDVEEKLSEKDDDDSAPDARTNSSSSVHCASAADLLAPFRLFPAGTGLIYTGGGVIRVPAHRPPGANGAPAGALPAQALIPPWSLQALQHSQQQAAAAGLHRASILANLAAHPLQAHPHLKDRLAGRRVLPSSLHRCLVFVDSPCRRTGTRVPERLGLPARDSPRFHSDHHFRLRIPLNIRVPSRKVKRERTSILIRATARHTSRRGIAALLFMA
jgi:hypothetical protein